MPACALKSCQTRVILQVKDEAISAPSDLRFSGSICHLFVLFLKVPITPKYFFA